MKRYKGIIFDLDGTLLDTIMDISDCMNVALEESQFPTFTYDEYKIKIGNGFRILVERSLPEEVDETTIVKVHRAFVDHYKNNYTKKTAPYDGIIKMLKELQSKGIKLAINSNKRDDFVKILVSKYFEGIKFTNVIGARKEIPSKPDPYSAKEIAETMELETSEILYIGDSNTDINTAINAGMDSIGVLWGFRSYEELKEAGAKYLVSKPSEIIEILDI